MMAPFNKKKVWRVPLQFNNHQPLSSSLAIYPQHKNKIRSHDLEKKALFYIFLFITRIMRAY